VFRHIKTFTVVLTAIVALAAASASHQLPTGGKTGDTAAPKKATTKPATTTKTKSARTAPVEKRQSTNSTPGVSVSGKWWTTGNDFGASEVFFEQNGELVSGAIKYADGRTGTFSGTMKAKRITFTWTNSSGDKGSGWLEQSWSNFLGGSYRHQNGQEGSWTMSRIAGSWCFNGSRDRMRKVNHSSRGELYYVTEDNGEEAGRLEGPFIYLAGDFGDLKGALNYKSNRIDFSNGMYWTWCGR
jgi:hypothetical protein